MSNSVVCDVCGNNLSTGRGDLQSGKYCTSPGIQIHDLALEKGAKETRRSVNSGKRGKPGALILTSEIHQGQLALPNSSEFFTKDRYFIKGRKNSRQSTVVPESIFDYFAQIFRKSHCANFIDQLQRFGIIIEVLDSGRKFMAAGGSWEESMVRRYRSTAGKRLLLGTCAMAVMLGSCNDVEDQTTDVSAQMPPTIRKIMAETIPADGHVHLIYDKDILEIKPTTQFCTFRPGYGLDGRQLHDALQKLGQAEYLDGTSRASCQIREWAGGPGLDELEKGTVFIRMEKTPNRRGKPYKLVLAVWQGQPAAGGAVWIAGIERLNGLRDEHVAIAAESPGKFEIYSNASADRDASELSELFHRGGSFREAVWTAERPKR